jgi:hypothetical protein
MLLSSTNISWWISWGTWDSRNFEKSIPNLRYAPPSLLLNVYAKFIFRVFRGTRIKFSYSIWTILEITSSFQAIIVAHFKLIGYY